MRATLAAAALASAAAVANWTIVAPNIATICTGISCTSATVCYVPVAANGVGTNILHSADGGITWAPTQEEPFALLLLDIAAVGLNVVTLGALTMEYSTDGALNFYSSSGALGAGQCIRGIDGLPGGFGAVGDWGLFTESNGVAVSINNGMNFSTDNITTLAADSRYGAFPSASTWLVAAGDWPGEGSDDDPPPSDNPPVGVARPHSRFIAHGELVDAVHYTTPVAAGSVFVKAKGTRMHLLRAPNGDLRWTQVRREAVNAANAARSLGAAAPTSWEAQLARTTDGGASWNVTFSRMGAFYFNDIACTNVTSCCAVAETGGGGVNGTFIFCTTDGGQSWTENNINSDPDASLIGIDVLGPEEYWAVGGELGALTPLYVTFYHSTDGGTTWQYDPDTAIPLQYGIDISCDAPFNCWAATLDFFTQETSIARLNN